MNRWENTLIFKNRDKFISILYMSLKKPTISVFFPCFNDERTIGKLVADVNVVLKDIASEYEIIVVDDGSKDSSLEVLKEIAKNNSKLKIVVHDKNKGYGAALISGFKNAKYDLVFYTDGDGQYDVSELPLLLRLMSEDVNFVNGIKLSRQDPTYRIFLGNLYSFVARWAFWLPIDDVDCDFRLIRRSIIEKIDLKSNSGSICVELVKKAERAGGIFRQVSVHHYNRVWGESQFFRIDRLFSTFIELFDLWTELMFRDKLKKA